MFKGQAWYEYLDEPMRDLVDMAYYIYDREALRDEGLHDYAFVVFPFAKAYEGFLKKYFHDIGLVSKKVVNSRQFRIGSSLNPDLPISYRKDTWLVEKLERFCIRSSNPEHHKLPQQLWQAWIKGRNRLFHYFPGHTEFIALDEAWDRLKVFKDVMEASMDCRSQIFKQGEKIDK
jgi:hypothetical protein